MNKQVMIFFKDNLIAHTTKKYIHDFDSHTKKLLQYYYIQIKFTYARLLEETSMKILNSLCLSL